MSKETDDARAEIMDAFPDMDMKSVAAGLRDGTIRLSIAKDHHDLKTPEAEAWLRDCMRRMADVLDPPN